MALETGTYISDLVPANPLGSDQIAYADDHIRLIKATLKASFPNVTGPVTLNQAQINQSMPIGGIIMWSQATVPAGWALCNGQTVAKSDGSGNITTPNLLDRFIVGAGNGYGLNNTGGVGIYSLSQAQMPVHSHTASTDGQGAHNHGGTTGAVGDHAHEHQNLGSVQAGGDNGGANVSVSTGYSSGRFQAPTLGAGAHSHSFTTDTQGAHSHNVTVNNAGSGAAIENRPPFYALYYIMKV
jgi:microcystin-dependent protein